MYVYSSEVHDDCSSEINNLFLWNSPVLSLNMDMLMYWVLSSHKIYSAVPHITHILYIHSHTHVHVYVHVVSISFISYYRVCTTCTCTCSFNNCHIYRTHVVCLVGTIHILMHTLCTCTFTCVHNGWYTRHRKHKHSTNLKGVIFIITTLTCDPSSLPPMILKPNPDTCRISRISCVVNGSFVMWLEGSG